MEDAWQRKRETQGSSRWRNGKRGEGGGLKGKRTKKFEQRKKNSCRLWVAMSTSLPMPFASYIIANWIRRGVAFFARDVRNVLPSLCLQTTHLCFAASVIISPLIKERGWIWEFMHTTVTEAVLVKSTRVSIPAERSPIMLGIQANDFVSVW